MSEKKRKPKFDELSKAQQRVVIAKDLLARLRRRTFTPETSTYLRVTDLNENETDARKAFRGAACRGCQIGGLFLCALDRHNKLAQSDMELIRVGRRREWQAGDGALRNYLTQWFTHAELDIVESFFEGWEDEDGPGKAGRFAKLVERHGDRMKMIAQNIVDGKGRFSATRLMKTARGWK